MAGLEADSIDEELLLDGGDGVVEQTRLAPVVEEGRASASLEGT